MDSKNKINETYLPDKNTKGEKVAIGLWGLDSFVTAYLLKIQKYDLVAFTIINEWQTEEAQKLMSCHANDVRMSSIKDFCHQLNIPHQFVKTSDEFTETVVNDVISARLTGTLPQGCWNCHGLRMKLLHQKMKQAGLSKLATGHYAKVFKHEAQHTCFLHTSNDEVHDQSGLLSRLPNEILSSLILPLSDLQRKEVLKLAENFGLKAHANPVSMHKCFTDASFFQTEVKPHLSDKLKRGGEVNHAETFDNLADHEGVIDHAYGEFYLKHQGKEDLFFTHFSFTDKKIQLAPPSYFLKAKFHLTDCHIADETPWSAPLKGSIQVAADRFVDCWVHPGSLKSALVELESPHKFLEGQIININRKQGKNAKVYLTGKVRYLPEPKEILEHETKSPQVNHNRDL